jgi:HNH endonuclease
LRRMKKHCSRWSRPIGSCPRQGRELPPTSPHTRRCLGLRHRKYLSGLNAEQRAQLEHRLHDRQKNRCFICDERIDFVLHKGQLDIDHIDPLIKDGLDSENNFALTHASCNRSKGASNLEVARRLAELRSCRSKPQSTVNAAPISAMCLKSMGGEGVAPSPTRG